MTGSGISVLGTDRASYVPFSGQMEISPEPETGFLETMKRARQKAEEAGQVPAASSGEAASGETARGVPEKAAAEKTMSGTELKKNLSGSDLKLYEQCEALEGFLIKNMLTGMRKTVMKSSLVDTGFAGEVYEDMLWDEYAKAYTQKADFGLAELAYMELKGLRGEVFL
jgi:flagellar protein FlgJ